MAWIRLLTLILLAATACTDRSGLEVLSAPRIYVSVHSEGTISINDEQVGLQNLGERLEAAVAEDPELLLVLGGDSSAPSSVVSAVLDQARISGVTNIAISAGERP